MNPPGTFRLLWHVAACFKFTVPRAGQIPKHCDAHHRRDKQASSGFLKMGLEPVGWERLCGKGVGDGTRNGMETRVASRGIKRLPACGCTVAVWGGL